MDMSIRMSFIFLGSVIVFQSGNTLAQATLPVTNNYINTMTKGALDNRNTANNLFKSSHHHHHQAQSSANAALMAQALTEAANALLADKQAQEMANNALSGMNSAALQTGDGASNASDVESLQDIANGPSPFAAPVQSDFAGDGIDLASAAQPTLTGTAQTSLPATNLGAAGPTGTPGPTALLVDRGLASIPSTPSEDIGKKNGPPDAPSASRASSLEELQAAVKLGDKSLLLDALKILANNQKIIRQQMGLPEENPTADVHADVQKDPIRPKDDDLFKVIHAHYTRLETVGEFYELHLPASESDALQAEAAMSNKKMAEQKREIILKQMPPPARSLFPF